MKPIPVDNTHSGTWIDYDNKILILKEDDINGNEAEWQWNGVMCRQASIKGIVVAEFESTSKFFDTLYWYENGANYFSKYPEKIMREILFEANNKTELNITINYWDDIAYGDHWAESFVPVIINGERHMLTWMNCD